MKRVFVSLLTIAAVGVLAFGVSPAFFSDKETSAGNSFTAGRLDWVINIDSEDVSGRPIFNNSDIKPGDKAEETLDMIVLDNPSCGTLTFTLTEDKDNSCVEPEAVAEGPNCPVGYYPNPPNPPISEGELNENIVVTIWEDSGATSGWQCPNQAQCTLDPFEGDNVRQAGERVITSGALVGNFGYHLGELPAGTPFHYGFEWEVPSAVGNIIQTDSFGGFFTFNAYQKRNQYPNGCPLPGPG